MGTVALRKAAVPTATEGMEVIHDQLSRYSV